MPSGFLAPKELSCLAFKSDDYELYLMTVASGTRRAH